MLWNQLQSFLPVLQMTFLQSCPIALVLTSLINLYRYSLFMERQTDGVFVVALLFCYTYNGIDSFNLLYLVI